MARDPIPTHFFVLAVVRHAGRFLLVQERKHGQRWYLPAGRVEPGEDLVAAVRRETREEAGIDIDVERVLRVEHTPDPSGTARVRLIFVAAPAPGSAGSARDVTPKQHADEHSLQAAWVTLAELDALQLRGPEVRELFTYVERGGATYPLGLLAPEGTPLG